MTYTRAAMQSMVDNNSWSPERDALEELLPYVARLEAALLASRPYWAYLPVDVRLKCSAALSDGGGSEHGVEDRREEAIALGSESDRGTEHAD